MRRASRLSTRSSLALCGRAAIRRLHAAVEALEPRMVLSTIIVNTVADQIDRPSSSTVSIRDAVARANQSGRGAVTISFDPTVFSTPQTINLNTLDNGGLALIDTDPAISIVGPSAGVTIAGMDGDKVLTIDSGVGATLSGLAVSSGSYSYSANYGHAIDNSGNLTVNDCTIFDSGAGGINNSGTLNLQDSTLYANSFTRGGGLSNTGTATVSNCTFANNTAASGPESPVVEGAGGGIDNAGMLTVLDCTFTGNVGDFGAAIETDRPFAIGNTITADNASNTDSGDVVGAVDSLGHNFIGMLDASVSSGWAASDRTGTFAQPLDADLSRLGYYGGPTQTQFPLADSLAILGGDASIIPSSDSTDQRGFSRTVGGHVDIGAVELQATSLITVTPPAKQSVVAGVPATINLGSFSDPAGSGPFIANINWGDGSPPDSMTLGAAGSLGTLTHTFVNTGPLSGSIEVYDGAGDVSQFAPLLVSSATAGAQTFTVNTALDQSDPASSATISLRDAVDRAGASFGPVMIDFDPTAFASSKTIDLLSELELTGDRFAPITIAGPTSGVTLSGQTVVVDSSITASISHVTITGVDSLYGGVQNAGNLTLTDSVVEGNTTTMVGGMIPTPTPTPTPTPAPTPTPTPTPTASIKPAAEPPEVGFVDGSGGGIANVGTMTIIDCTISGNTAKPDQFGGGDGGGIYNFGTLVVSDSTLSANHAQDGGGLQNFLGMLTLTNCTISGNDAATQGGGLWDVSSGSVALADCTISANSSGTGAGGVEIPNDREVFSLTNSVIAGNTGVAASPDFSGPATSQGHNLVGNAAGSEGWLATDLLGNAASPVDPRLAALADNGGPTLTQLPQAGSPAIAAGLASLVPAGVTADQRGLPRVVNGGVDIGAVQLQDETATTGTGTTGTLTTGTGNTNPGPLAVTLTGELQAEAVAGSRVALTQALTLANSAGTKLTVHARVALSLSSAAASSTSYGITPSPTRAFTLKPDASRTLRLRATSFLASIPAGTYHLIAEVTDSAGTAEAVSAGTITIVPATIAFSGTIAPAPASIAVGGKLAVKITATNAGNTAVTGRLPIVLYLSTDGQADANATQLLSANSKMRFPPGKSIHLTFHAIVPKIPANDYFVVAVLDGSGTIAGLCGSITRSSAR